MKQERGKIRFGINVLRLLIVNSVAQAASGGIAREELCAQIFSF